ncbi:hypothetical protein [Spiroplasma tabanidicola]|uniref:Uncharacterized protein n=1 Tax=Spiroplasma tabanidicola TaxID=324079 RepID=A0A6I6CCV0_9MOLU|nr:hypothetical protein [Spiroplasma tabanidicola]QGS51794.1 hypothetical protein STABA_v1c04310 [Spiroplasma tabanidicola]
MAVQKKSNANKKETSKPGSEYVWQPFGQKALALINKYNLQTEENYKKLISSFDRIQSLPNDDPRRPNLIELWETEFNRLFKHFWQTFANNNKRQESNIAGWKDRLNVKVIPNTPDAKRQDLMSRLSGAGSTGRRAQEEILSRAGYQNVTTTEPFNFKAQPKTGQSLYEIENILDAVEGGVDKPGSILENNNSSGEFVGFGTVGAVQNNDDNLEELDVDEETRIMTQEVKPDPNLLDFVNGTSSRYEEEQDEDVIISNETNQNAPSSESTNTLSYSQNIQNREFVGSEDMSRQQFNVLNNIQSEYVPPQDSDALAVLELGTEFFQEQLGRHGLAAEPMQEGQSPFVYTDKDNLINPEKRNILSREGFEIYKSTDDAGLKTEGKPNYDISTGEVVKPFHEIRPVGNYGITYDYKKRPSMQDFFESQEKEGRVIDEMTQKIEFLRDLRNERRHRINMMKIERANSYIVARARRLAEARELRRLKRREDINLKAIEKAERMRRLHERQKLIQLMKDRQLKRAEEKRVATVLKLERERRLERDAKYRSEIASIDAQIRHEQELIKRTELKMKAYFTKVHDDQLFDESLRVAKKSNQFIELEQKAELMQELEEQKRKDRIEKISRKFNKNIK